MSDDSEMSFSDATLWSQNGGAGDRDRKQIEEIDCTAKMYRSKEKGRMPSQ
jgi:hypothetical protein